MMVRMPAKSRSVKSCCDGEAKIAALAVADGLFCEGMPLTLTSERMEARPRVRRGEKWSSKAWSSKMEASYFWFCVVNQASGRKNASVFRLTGTQARYLYNATDAFACTLHVW